MSTDTNLSTSPYYDDFDANNNFYRVLYRPSNPVQVREMNQTQSIMQDQIEKFGRNIFKDGSVVDGCSFVYDNNYYYVKIKDQYSNGTNITSLSSFVDLVGYNSAGLKSLIVNTEDGLESNDPDLNTLYVKYLNSTTFSNGDIQQEYSNNELIYLCTNDSSNTLMATMTVAPVVNSTGKGYAFTTSSGTIFQKGFFISVQPQTLVISKYNNVPDGISVGFDSVEEIVTPETDTSLYDNAAGSPNYTAPGAHRLKLTPTLVYRNTNSVSNSASFFSLCDFKNGLPVSVKNNPQYAALGADMARRTYETNGDYVVNPFILSVQNKYDSDHNANASYLSLVSSPGIGYVKGYRVEFINNNVIDLRKGNDPALDIEAISNQIVSVNYGYYFQVKEYVGDFNNNGIQQIQLHSITKNAVANRTFLSTGYSSGSKIGTAYVRGVSYAGKNGSDDVYNVYLFNIQMSPGYSISSVKSLIYDNGGSAGAIADVIQSYDANLQANIAKLVDATNEVMIHPFGQKAIVPDGFSSTSFVYRDKTTSSFASGTGLLSLTLAAANGTGGSPATSEAFAIQASPYSSEQEKKVIVIPTQTGTSTKTGTVTVYTANTLVLGSSTTFATDYNVGDYILVNNETRKVTSIANNTNLYVDAVFVSATSGVAHKKSFPTGVPINFSNISARTIAATSSTMTITLSDIPDSTFNATVYYDVARSNCYPIKKNVNKNCFVKINVGTNTSGPWSLGVPDVFRLKNVYVGSGTYSTSNPDLVNTFSLDSGQRDAYYDLASISTGSPLPVNSTLLVCFDAFTFDEGQGHGFFTANSYPIDDANTANTTAIQTAEIPIYVSKNSGTSIDLRDVVDFRPYANATANVVFSSSDSNITTTPSNTLTLFVQSSLGSYLPSPDSQFLTNLEHYMPRKDRVALTTTGQMIITEGVPSNIPTTPLEIPGTMTIGVIDVPAYPALTPADAASLNRYDYSVQTTIQQTKRFTMSDIGRIGKRIDRLEYYVSLSLLEKSAASLLVRSNITGQNRFQNGILVDPFSDHSIGNTNDAKYRIAIDPERKEARPYFWTQRVNLKYDETSSTTQKTGSLITLPYSNTPVYQSQAFASKYHNCIEGNVYRYRGVMYLDPPGTVDADLTRTPIVTGSIDRSTNWVNMPKSLSTAWGSQWAAWSTTSALSNSIGSPNQTATNPDGSVSQSFQSQTTTTLDQQLARNTQTLLTNSGDSATQQVAGNFVTNISISPYIKPTTIFFKAEGMKPSTRLYAFFASMPVSGLCLPMEAYDGTRTTVAGIPTSANNKPLAVDSFGNYYEYETAGWGTALNSDESGKVYGAFKIPGGVFTGGDLEFRLADVSDLSRGESAITTQAIKIYHATPISIQKNIPDSQVFPSYPDITEVNDIHTVQQTPPNTENYNYNAGDISGAPFIVSASGFDGAELVGQAGDRS